MLTQPLSNYFTNLNYASIKTDNDHPVKFFFLFKIKKRDKIQMLNSEIILFCYLQGLHLPI